MANVGKINKKVDRSRIEDFFEPTDSISVGDEMSEEEIIEFAETAGYEFSKENINVMLYGSGILKAQFIFVGVSGGIALYSILA